MLRIRFENYENLENRRRPCDNCENHESLRILFENNVCNENHEIPHENHDKS